MVRTRTFLLASLIPLAVCSCGEEDATCLLAPESRTVPIEPGPMCRAGGTMVFVDGDSNCNAIFEDRETTSTVIVCAEDPGNMVDVPPEHLVEVVAIVPGDTCIAGGSAVRAGRDDDRDGVLDEEEVDQESVICNGEDGMIDENNCDGEARVYTGTLVIEDEAGFAPLQDVTCVDGNVIVSSDSIARLDGAATLRKVTGDVLIIGNSALLTLQGLRALEWVGGSMMVQNNDLLLDLSGLDTLVQFSTLQIVGNKALTSLHGLDNIEVTGGELEINAVPELRDLSGLENLRQVRTLALQNLDALVDVSQLSSLERATGQLIIIGNDALTSLSLPIRRVDASIDLFENGVLEEAAFPALLLLRDLRIRDNPALRRLSLSELATAAGVELTSNMALETFSAPSLVYLSADLRAGTNVSLLQVDLPSLGTIAGAVSFRGNTALSDFEGLRNLKSVGGAFTLRESSAVARFGGLAALETINGNVIFRDNPTLISLSELTSLREISGTLEIVGNRQLATSEAQAFSMRVSVGDSVTIMGNGPN